jgi:hypothetical protein
MGRGPSSVHPPTCQPVSNRTGHPQNVSLGQALTDEPFSPSSVHTNLTPSWSFPGVVPTVSPRAWWTRASSTQLRQCKVAVSTALTMLDTRWVPVGASPYQSDPRDQSTQYQSRPQRTEPCPAVPALVASQEGSEFEAQMLEHRLRSAVPLWVREESCTMSANRSLRCR